MHPHNAFITLTYDDAHLTSDKLVYRDFQLFMKKLRKLQDAPMGMFVTGEYGDKDKRPHWHAIIFNYRPRDLSYWRKNENGDCIYRSKTIEGLWGRGFVEVGDVTFQSAGYVARYAAKKLRHGRDGEHDYEPISKKSNKQAIGKAWIEANWRDVFRNGTLRLEGGVSCSIPRYYIKWLKENNPTEWLRYVTQTKLGAESQAEARSAAERREYARANYERSLRTARDGVFRGHVTSKAVASRALTAAKFQTLQSKLKL